MAEGYEITFELPGRPALGTSFIVILLFMLILGPPGRERQKNTKSKKKAINTAIKINLLQVVLIFTFEKDGMSTNTF